MSTHFHVEFTYPGIYHAKKMHLCKKIQPARCPRLHLSLAPGGLWIWDASFQTRGHSLSTCSSARLPSPEQGVRGPFLPEEPSCSHFPDDAIPAGARSLFGGVFFHSLLLFFPFLDPGTGPSHVCFPSALTPTAGPTNGRGTRYLDDGGDTRQC